MEETKKERLVYFIENPEGLWYWLNPSFEEHVTSSNPRYRCDCKRCRGDDSPIQGWTNNPLEAFTINEKETAEWILQTDTILFKDCKVTEHLFV